jgi:hypothetical protein
MPQSSMVTGIVGALSLCLWYICLSAGLISFNKYLIHPDRFPFPLVLTAIHMAMTCFLSLVFYKLCPSWYPSINKAIENKAVLLKFLVPMAILFSASLWMSNKAYAYSSVAFLQFIKETNLTVVYLLSCLCGLQTLVPGKLGMIFLIIAGCSLCVHGEVHFAMTGLILQVTALLCECTKNVMGEVVLTGAGLKLDPLTFNLFQAPLTFIPLCIGAVVAHATGNMNGVLTALSQNWHLILPNSMMAFVLNITLTAVIKHLSAVSFVLAGLVKDVVIVLASGLVFGDAISHQQIIGFTIIITGVACWSQVRLAENAAKQQAEEAKQALQREETPSIMMHNKDCEYGATKASIAKKAAAAY